MPNFSSRHNSTRLYDHPKDHNPEEFEGDTVTLYRGQGGDGETLGIHWTTDPSMMIEHGGYTVHRVDAPRSAILPRTEWFDRRVSLQRALSYQEKKEGVTEAWSPTQWGFDIEQEVRLRPGAVVFNHATGEYQPDSYDYKWNSTGRSPVIDINPEDKYKNLAHSAVQGTPQAESLHRYQQSLPHVQPPLPFEEDEFYDPITNKSMGHVPSFDDDYDKNWDIEHNRVENELIAKHGKMVDVRTRGIGETVPLSNLTNHMGPQFEQPKQPDPVDPNQLEIPGTKSAWELWRMRNE